MKTKCSQEDEHAESLAYSFFLNLSSMIIFALQCM